MKTLFLSFLAFFVFLFTNSNACASELCPKELSDADSEVYTLTDTEQNVNSYTLISKQGCCVYYKNKNLAIEFPLKANTVETVKKYFESGNVDPKFMSSDGYFQKNRLIDGIAKFYYEDGAIKAIIPVKDGLREGIAKNFYKTGELEGECLFKNDNIEGMSKSYFQNGKLKEETIFLHGKKEGTSKRYFLNGKIQEETNYLDGKREGIVKIYNEEGKIIKTVEIQNDKLNGNTKQYYDNGKLKYLFQYKDGINHGIHKSYYESGKLQSEQKYDNGKTDKSTYYYESGKVSSILPQKIVEFGEGEYKFTREITEGVVISYYENGIIKSKEPYVNDSRNGTAKFYDKDGRLNEEVNYKNGSKEGVFNKYRSNGKLFATFIYKEDKPVSGMCKSLSGKDVPLTNAELENWENGLSIECQ